MGVGLKRVVGRLGGGQRSVQVTMTLERGRWGGVGGEVGGQGTGLLCGSSESGRSGALEAFGSPGGGLGRHRSAEAREVLGAAHVGSLETGSRGGSGQVGSIV